MYPFFKTIKMKVWTPITKAFLRFPIALALFALPAPYQTGHVNGEFLESRDAQATFHFVDGCITTDVTAVVVMQEIRQIPGNERLSIQFSVMQVYIASEPQNGPECENFIIQNSFISSHDLVSNFHPIVMEVSPDLSEARIAGSGSFFDFEHMVLRDMAFDITWQATSQLVQDHFNENGEGYQINNVFLNRDAIASGTIKECDNEFEGPVDGLCTPEDWATAPNLLTAASDPELTDIFEIRFTQIRHNH